MKKQIAKSVLAAAMAVAMTVTSAGTVFADDSFDAETTAAADEETSSVTAENAVTADVWKDFTPSVSSVDIDMYSSSADVSFTGKGRNFNVYLNGTKTRTVEGYYNSEEIYDAEGYETGYYTYEVNSTNESFYLSDLSMATAYTVRIVPTDKDDHEVASAAYTTSFTTESPRTSLSVYSSDPSSTDVKYRSGYRSPRVHLSWWSNIDEGTIVYEIWRSNSANSGFAKIASVDMSKQNAETEYEDKTVAFGKNKMYYYKVRPIVNGKAQAFSDTEGYGYSVDLTGSLHIVLDKNGKPVIYASSDLSDNFVAGYDIYRSTKQNKGFKKIVSTTDDRYIDTSVKSGKTYFYKVTPYYLNGANKKVAGTASEASGVKLSMPGELQFYTVAQSTSKAKLNWKKLSNVDGYDVFMTSDMPGDCWKLVKSLGKKKKSLTVKKLSANQSYTFRLQAFKYKTKKGKKAKVKTSFLSVSDSVYTGLTPPEITITNRSFSSNAAKNVITIKNTMKWDKLVGISGYKIYKGDYDWNDTTQKPIATLGASATSYTYTQTLSAKDHSTTYLYIVAYKGTETRYDCVRLEANIGSVSGISVKRAAAVKDQYGDVVKNPRNGVTISWKPAAGATSYTVYRRTPSGSSVYVGGGLKTTSVQDWGLVKGVEYTYVVSAENDVVGKADDDYLYSDDQVYSNLHTYPYAYGKEVMGSYEKNFCIATATTKVKKAANKKGKKVVVSWSKVNGATGYVVYRSTKKKSGYVKVGSVNGKKTSFTDKKLTKKKTYYYKVVVESSNEIGLTVTSGLSNCKSVKIKK